MLHMICVCVLQYHYSRCTPVCLFVITYLYESYSLQCVARWLSKTGVFARLIAWWCDGVHTAITNRSMIFQDTLNSVGQVHVRKIAEVLCQRLSTNILLWDPRWIRNLQIDPAVNPPNPAPSFQVDPQRLNYHLFHALTTEVLANELKLSLQVKGAANVEGPLGIRLLIRLECTIHCAVEKLFDPPARNEVVQSKECQYKYFWGL